MSINGLIGYYRDCFQEDSADFNLRNMQRLPRSDLLFLTGTDEIASGNLHRLPIQSEYGESFAKRSQIYLREKTLLHCSLFLTGNLVTESETIKLFCPLVINEARIERDEYGYYFSTEHSSPSVNEELLSLLLPDSWQQLHIERENIYSPAFWIQALASSIYQINDIQGLYFPKLAEKTEVAKAMRRKEPSLLPISTLAFVERSVSSRGIIHELSSLQNQQKHSAPLQQLLAKSTDIAAPRSVNHNLVPALLSSAQQRVLEIAATQKLGVVSGPPGTGKSYTIAAAAAEHFTRGQSVLIVAASETALDVIATKLEQDFDLKNLFVRVGQKSKLRDFKQYLSDLLAGYHQSEDIKKIESYSRELSALIETLEADEKQLEKLCSNAIRHGQRRYKVVQGQANLWDKLLDKLSTPSIERLQRLWQIHQFYNQHLQQKELLSANLLRATKAKAIKGLLDSDRKAIQTLNRAVRARTSSKQAEYFTQANFSNLLKGFPVWLVSLNTLHKVLPLETAQFNLVIIDEATQCNIASAIPALERANRALLVGDQKQLRHLSFISRIKEQQITARHQVQNNSKAMSYRDNSILDLALEQVSSQRQIAFLDEHFRSQPELINFSNSNFYDSKLKVMQHRPCSTTGHIRLRNIGGERSDSGINRAEAEAVLTEVRQLVSEAKELGLHQSIGILSPFSKQANYLRELIEKQLSVEEIEKHQILVSTPYAFQGEERDIMLISFAIDDNSKRAAVYLNKADVFNVSITRARQVQTLYTSFDHKQLPANSLLKQYLNSIATFNLEHNTEQQPDEFQLEVCQELEANQILFWRGYEMLGTYIDILARKNGKYLAIDLIGYPGPWRDYFELNTYKVIKRAGIDVFPLSYALWTKNRAACIKALLEYLRDPPN